MKLDYNIKTPEERVEALKNINIDNPESAADYILQITKNNREILTDNRLVTVNKRETSYQGLVEKFENGEDGVYNLIHEDKNVILSPKVSISPSDVAEIPPLQNLREAIDLVESSYNKASGRRKFLLKKQLIEMRQEQYSIKNEYKPVMRGRQHNSINGASRFNRPFYYWCGRVTSKYR